MYFQIGSGRGIGLLVTGIEVDPHFYLKASQALTLNAILWLAAWIVESFVGKEVKRSLNMIRGVDKQCVWKALWNLW